ncbi:type II toxin-antitoxin system RnlB family antitoxin [Pseudomonas chlororaphis]|uniref:type II toxin-antitoxin system RnlB family antitoxin n=1 Tax=Pseudomonas chlororaphis TaxID=587753 RepID=UPI000F564B45
MFEIKRSDTSNGLKTVVIATSYENPLSSLSAIAKQMLSEHHTHTEEVIFDLLCANGDEWNRFAAIEYNGHSFVRSTFHILPPSSIDSKLIESQSHYFASHPEFLENSVL